MSDKKLVDTVSNIRLQCLCERQDRSSTSPRIIGEQKQPEAFETTIFLDIVLNIAVRIANESNEECN